MLADVSIIIPTYNRLWALPRAVESCRALDCNAEIIVVDDGSTDGTWDWLQKQKHVVAIRQDNWGKDCAVNKGFERSCGEFVRFLDSDDWLVVGATERQIAIGRSESADVVVAGYRVSDEINQCERDIAWTSCDDFIAQQLGECDGSHYSAFLFRRSFIENVSHRQEFGPRDDRMFIIEVAMKKPRVAVYDDRPAFVHRHHARERLQFGTGMRAVVTNWQHLNVYKKALTIMEARGELTPRRMSAAVNMLWPLAHRVAYTHPDDACAVARWIYELNPDFRPPETGLLGLLYRQCGFRNTERLLLLRRSFMRRLQPKYVSSRQFLKPLLMRRPQRCGTK